MAETPPRSRLAEALEQLADEIGQSRLQTAELRREAREIAGAVGELAAAVRANVGVQDREALLLRGDMNGIGGQLAGIAMRLDDLAGVPAVLECLPSELVEQLALKPREPTGSVALVPTPSKEEKQLQPGLRWNVGGLSIPLGSIGGFLFRFALPGVGIGGAVHFLLEFIKNHVH